MKKFFKRTFATVICVLMFFTIATSCTTRDKTNDDSLDTSKEVHEINRTEFEENELGMPPGESSGPCGENLTWTYNSETDTLDISGTGDMEDYGQIAYYGDWEPTREYAPWHWGAYDENLGRYISPIKTINIGDEVTSIGNMAFCDCENLTTVNIGKSVTKIGDDAFYGCDSLESITIPASVKEVVGTPFSGCDNLKNIEADPDNQYLSNDSYGVLFNKDKTKLVEYPNGNTRNSYIIPDTVKCIGEKAFYACDHLINVTIPESVTKIEKHAFLSCEYLAGIIIPDSVTEMGEDVFSDCYNLKRVRIGKSLTSIPHSAFRGCAFLERVEISSVVTKIENAAFDCDFQLKDIYYEGSKANWKNITIGINSDWQSKVKYHYDFSFEEKDISAVTPELASLTNTKNGPKLSWEHVDTAKGYHIYRKTKGTSWENIGSTVSTDFTDKASESGTKYSYTVKAYNDISTSKYEKGLSIIYLEAPNLKTIANTTEGVEVTWEKVTGAKGYYIYRKPKTVGESSYTQIGKTKSTSFVDETATGGTTYYYTVRAYKGSTESSYNGGERCRYLEAPTISSIKETESGVEITWGKIRNARDYGVYRKEGADGEYKPIGGAESEKFVDKKAKKGTTYYYAVKARSLDSLHSGINAGIKFTTKK